MARRILRPVSRLCRDLGARARRHDRRRRCDDHLRAAENRAPSGPHDREGGGNPADFARPGQRQGDDDREARFHRPRRRPGGAGGRDRAGAALNGPRRAPAAMAPKRAIARSGAGKRPQSKPRRLGLPLWHPAALIATWFGAGLLPWMPGTWGSLAALPFAWAIRSYCGTAGLSIAAVVLFLVGWWAA